jgi:hypothetical protein
MEHAGGSHAAGFARASAAAAGRAEGLLWPAGGAGPDVYAGMVCAGLRDADVVCAAGRTARSSGCRGAIIWVWAGREDAWRLRWMDTLEVWPSPNAGGTWAAEPVAILAPRWAAARRHRGGAFRGLLPSRLPSRLEAMVPPAVERSYAEPAALGCMLGPAQAETAAVYGIDGEDSETRMVQLRPWHERTGSYRTYRSAMGFAAECGLGGPLTRADRRALRLGHLRGRGR